MAKSKLFPIVAALSLTSMSSVAFSQDRCSGNFGVKIVNPIVIDAPAEEITPEDVIAIAQPVVQVRAENLAQVDIDVPASEPTTYGELLQKIAINDTIHGEIGLIEAYEKKIEFYRRLSGSYERTSVENANQKRRNVDGFLMRGQVSKAIDEWRKLFRDVELNYYTILSLERQIELANLLPSTAAESTGRAALVHDLQVKLDVAITRFGTQYGEYVGARMHLENAIKERKYQDLGRSNREQASALESVLQEHPNATKEQLEDLYVTSAEQTLNALGINNMKTMFPGLNLPSERVSLQNVKDLFRNRAQALLAKLKKDLVEQRWTFAKTFTLAEPALKLLESSINLLPSKWSHQVKEFLGLARGLRARRRFLAKVDAILSMPNDPKSQLKELRSLNAPTNDTFLTFFVQHTEGSEVWLNMKKEAKALAADPDNAIYKSFYERMIAAEKRGLGSDVSPNYTPNPADVVAAVAATGLATYFGMNFDMVATAATSFVEMVQVSPSIQTGLAVTGGTGATMYVGNRVRQAISGAAEARRERREERAAEKTPQNATPTRGAGVRE